jgi:hypothetical protein
VNPLTPGMTARKLAWMHEGRKQCGELSSVLAEVFGPQKKLTTNDPRILFPH